MSFRFRSTSTLTHVYDLIVRRVDLVLPISDQRAGNRVIRTYFRTGARHRNRRLRGVGAALAQHAHAVEDARAARVSGRQRPDLLQFGVPHSEAAVLRSHDEGPVPHRSKAFDRLPRHVRDSFPFSEHPHVEDDQLHVFR